MGTLRRSHRHLVTGRGVGGVVVMAGVALAAVASAACAPVGGASAGGQAAESSGPASSEPVGAPAVTAPAVTATPQPTAVLSPVPPSAPPALSRAETGTATRGTGGSGQGFVWSVATVTAADLPHSWREGCPVGPSQLRAATVGYHAMDGGVRTGVLVIHADIVEPTRRVFARLFELGFPITSIRPVDDFGGSDDASMAADNTSGFNCRAAVSNGPTTWSKHAYGRAIDVNPTINPYILDGEVLPPGGARYTDRSKPVPGMITAGSPALKAFTDNGFTWGGTWSNPDYQHFQR